MLKLGEKLKLVERGIRFFMHFSVFSNNPAFGFFNISMVFQMIHGWKIDPLNLVRLGVLFIQGHWIPDKNYSFRR